MLGNLVTGNGAFGNLTNRDLANAALDYPVRNCFMADLDVKGTLTSFSGNIQDPAVLGSSSGAWLSDPNQEPALFLELICNAFGPVSGACSPSDHYPTSTSVTLLPIPPVPGMVNPCDGVPTTGSWCNRS